MRKTTKKISNQTQTWLAPSQKYDDTVRRLVFCLFNRATYSRIRALLQALEKAKGFEVTVLTAGGPSYMEKDLKTTSIVRFPVTEDCSHLGSVIKTSQIADLFGRWLDEHKEKITAVVVTGDRFETLGAAMAASYLNLPLIHIQGGEITGNIDEKVRHAITKLADYHFVATHLAEKYVLRMGEDAFRVFKTGCPSLDVITRAKINRFKPKEKYIICQFHPETENSEEAADQTEKVLYAVVEFCRIEAYHCYVYWPNPDPGRDAVIETLEWFHEHHSNVLIKAKNQEPEDFLWRLAGSGFMVGNSSCGLRECSFLGVPSINVGDRQSTRERGYNCIDVGYKIDEIVAAMCQQFFTRKFSRSYLYGNGESSYEIIDRLLRIDYTLKPPLNYPKLTEFHRSHFGEDRFKRHKVVPKRAL